MTWSSLAKALVQIHALTSGQVVVPQGPANHAPGNVSQGPTGTLEVTELPVRRWTQDYKEFLEGMVRPEKPEKGKEEVPALLTDYSEHHTGASVHFSLQVHSLSSNHNLCK